MDPTQQNSNIASILQALMASGPMGNAPMSGMSTLTNPASQTGSLGVQPTSGTMQMPSTGQMPAPNPQANPVAQALMSPIPGS